MSNIFFLRSEIKLFGVLGVQNVGVNDINNANSMNNANYVQKAEPIQMYKIIP
jgi:hypothetical protein